MKAAGGSFSRVRAAPRDQASPGKRKRAYPETPSVLLCRRPRVNAYGHLEKLLSVPMADAIAPCKRCRLRAAARSAATLAAMYCRSTVAKSSARSASRLWACVSLKPISNEPDLALAGAASQARRSNSSTLFQIKKSFCPAIRGGKDFVERLRRSSERAVTDGDFRSDLEPTAFRLDQQFAPALRAFPHADLEADASLRSRSR